MVEELKIIAEMMKGITDGALYGVVFYMIMSYLKPVTIVALCGYFILKITNLSVKKADELEEK